MDNQWWCWPEYTRSQRKRMKLRVNDVVLPERRDRRLCIIDSWGQPNSHDRCGYRDPLGRIIPRAPEDTDHPPGYKL